jgi:Transposase domain (DUF772)
MAHISGSDRSQLLLLPAVVDDYVGSDNPVRFIDAFVDGLDLVEAGFARVLPKATGRPGYAAGDLLKLYVYGYLNRVRSSRRLEAECHRNIEVIWLARRLVLRVGRCLNVVADADLRMRRHGPAVGIGQRYSALPRAFEFRQHRVVSTALLAKRLDLFCEIVHARAARSSFRDIAFVKPLEVIVETLIGGLDECLQRAAREVAVLVVDRLDARPVHRQQFASEQIEPLGKGTRKMKRALLAAAIMSLFVGTGRKPDMLGQCP